MKYSITEVKYMSFFNIFVTKQHTIIHNPTHWTIQYTKKQIPKNPHSEFAQSVMRVRPTSPDQRMLRFFFLSDSQCLT